MGSGALAWRLYDFQIKQQPEFLAKVPQPSLVTTRIPGVRGRILDRNGIVLARNRISYEVDINLQVLADAYAARYSDDANQDVVRKDGDGMLRQRTQKDIVKIFNEFLIPRLKVHDLAANYNAGALRNHFNTHGGLVPFTYREDLSFEEFSRYAEHRLEFPGLEVVVRPRREYPFGSLGSHLLGYVKPWDKGDISAADRALFSHFVGDVEGVAGVEKTMNSALLGPPGKQVWLRDERGHYVRIIEEQDPGRGADLQMTIDARIQFFVEEELRRVGRGAAVVLDVQTGEVLAMASVPDFNPNDFIPSISQSKFDLYRVNEARPFTNRAIAAFEPGSTFKLGSALCGCHHGLRHRQFHCSGGVSYGNTFMRCWIHSKGGQHGTISLDESIQRSCNSYFYLLANALGPAKMVNDFESMGIGQRTGIRLPNESPGILPGSSWWRRKNRGSKLTPALTAQLSIGQGDTQATPLQMACLTAAIANDGILWKPRIIQQFQELGMDEPKVTQPEIRADLQKLGFAPSAFTTIKRGMRWAVGKPGGTASRAGLEGVLVCAKTGTAQTIDRGKKSQNAWTVSFAPYEAPKYAVVVMVRGGESGGLVAAPIAGRIYDKLFALDDQALPIEPIPAYPGNLRKVVSVDRNSFSVETSGPPPSRAVVVSPAPSQPIPQPRVRDEADVEGSVVRRAVPVRPNRPSPRPQARRVRPQARRAVPVEPPIRRAVPVE